MSTGIISTPCFLLFVVFFVFFQPVARLLFKAVKKVLQANKLDITLYVERRIPLCLKFLKKMLGIYQRSDCSVSPRSSHCLCRFSSYFFLPTARAPPVFSRPHYTVCSSTGFLVSFRRRQGSASIGLKPSWNLKTDTWSYLNLLQNLYVLSCSSLASYIVHNKYIIIMLTGCLC